MRDLAEQRHRRNGRVFVLVGARSPDQILFAEDLEAWRAAGLHVGVTVDLAAPGWDGSVGVVTVLLPSGALRTRKRRWPYFVDQRS